MEHSAQSLSDKIQELSGEQLLQVEHFVLSLQTPALAVTRASAQLSEPSFSAVWDNPEDEAYDVL